MNRLKNFVVSFVGGLSGSHGRCGKAAPGARAAVSPGATVSAELGGAPLRTGGRRNGGGVGKLLAGRMFP